MQALRKAHVRRLRRRVRRSTYRVDPQAVAGALLARLSGAAGPRRLRGGR